MSEWWTYRLSDFLLFAPRTYWRQLELLNEQVWPGQLPLLAIGVGLVVVLARGDGRWQRVANVVVALLWVGVAWAFHLQRYAGIHWLAPWFAGAFVLQALALLALQPDGRRSLPGAGLLAFAVLAYPCLGALAGRPWSQAEVFGLAPDPTALGTLGLLLAQPRRHAWAWPVPLAWCAVSGATLWAMEDALAWLPPAAAVAALAVAGWVSARFRG